MKVVDVTVNDGEVSVELDLFEGRKLPQKTKAKIQEQVGEFIVEQTLASMAEKKSPVEGAPNYAPLSKNYKKRKLAEVGSGEANLEFEGAMKDELNYEATDKGIAVGVYGERAGAADGHNNLSGKSDLPLRKFLPDKGENYKQNIAKGVDRIIADIVGEEASFKKRDFKDVSTKKELYEKLEKSFGSMSRAELKLAVFRNEDLTDLLSELDLIDLL